MEFLFTVCIWGDGASDQPGTIQIISEVFHMRVWPNVIVRSHALRRAPITWGWATQHVVFTFHHCTSNEDYILVMLDSPLFDRHCFILHSTLWFTFVAQYIHLLSVFCYDLYLFCCGLWHLSQNILSQLEDFMYFSATLIFVISTFVCFNTTMLRRLLGR